MPAIILDGKKLAKEMEFQLAERVQGFISRSGGQTPTLATVLVGDDPASAVYVRMKRNACRRIGMQSRRVELPQGTSTEELLNHINCLNADPDVHGILLQHPVPAQVDERRCFDAIRPDKDVDGVTCHGFGRMAMGETAYGSATPAGIMRLLAHYAIPIKGRRAAVVGRSPILGKPMAMMLLNAHATVTICHSRTTNLADIVRQADLVVGAVGKPCFIQGGWIADDAIVIDAGYHEGGVGDVDLRGAVDRCAAYTPVPGGVGPMTIATLMAQTLSAAESQATEKP